MRHQKCAIWSTPYGYFLMPNGVLHMVTVELTFACDKFDNYLHNFILIYYVGPNFRTPPLPSISILSSVSSVSILTQTPHTPDIILKQSLLAKVTAYCAAYSNYSGCLFNSCLL